MPCWPQLPDASPEYRLDAPVCGFAVVLGFDAVFVEQFFLD